MGEMAMGNKAFLNLDKMGILSLSDKLTEQSIAEGDGATLAHLVRVHANFSYQLQNRLIPGFQNQADQEKRQECVERFKQILFSSGVRPLFKGVTA